MMRESTDTGNDLLGRTILVTGGAGFIGSNLARRLVHLGAKVRVADNSSRGTEENLRPVLPRLSVIRADLTNAEACMKATRGASYVFHLAATVGGIHYILKENVRGLTPSLLMNTDMLEAARKCDVERFLFASSACVYREKDLRLNRFREEDAYPANPLTTYGWTKLMGEIQCKAYFLDYGIRASALRIFNAYGENETHAIIALIAKALLKMEPYVIWGSGNQSRNFTYVDDIVDAIVKAAEKIDDGSAVNAGRDDSVTIDQAAELVFDIVGWRPREINHDLSKPQGVASRAADLSRAKEVLVWSPKVSYEEGFRRTIEWYFARKKPDHVRADLDRLLMER